MTDGLSKFVYADVAVGLVGGPVRQPLLPLGAEQLQAVEVLMVPATV